MPLHLRSPDSVGPRSNLMLRTPTAHCATDPRALIESFLAGEEEALAIVDGVQADRETNEIVDNVVDLSGQYFVIDGDLTYRYIADEILPGSRFERSDDYYDEAA